ncbi:hypothetical protein BX666DRAFT_1864706 [Dichotomocladium elegans]|nr:hypothetical protein BX666DRAFT_1864706 [Dichotomocladium elegans]
MDGQGPLSLTQHRLALELRSHPIRGRGVFTRERIPRNTLVEISPVLLFTKEEYEAHGKHTVLDHYTYIWKDGKFALALGLGSMFNHRRDQNVCYYIDYDRNVIRYFTLREIEPDEELCISYGSNLWFEDTEENESIPDEQEWLAGFNID